MSGPFRLFPVAQRWWEFIDYEHLLGLVERFRPRTALEFGAGFSTLALVEGGATVDTLEDDPHWYDVHRSRGLFQGHPVALHLYQHVEPLAIPETDGKLYDFAFVDGPRQTPLRTASIEYAALRSGVVACHDATSEPIRLALERLGADGWAVEIIPYTRPRGDENAMGVAVRPTC